MDIDSIADDILIELDYMLRRRYRSDMDQTTYFIGLAFEAHTRDHHKADFEVCKNPVCQCAYRLEQKQSAQATQMNWKFHLYEKDAPEEGGYYEAAVGAHYLWVARRKGGGWQLTVADEAAESLASRVIEEPVPLADAKREAVMLYISLLRRWLSEAVSQV